MRLLIDGNNLLHVSDLFGSSHKGSPSSQQLLVELLVRLLGRRAHGTIVFDGRSPDAVLSSGEGLRVLHPLKREDADDVLERLIAAEGEPKQTLVVSSDHRIQRAARQRGIAYRDSEDYWNELRQLRATAALPTSPADKPAKLSAEEVQAWLREFGG